MEKVVAAEMLKDAELEIISGGKPLNKAEAAKVRNKREKLCDAIHVGVISLGLFMRFGTPLFLKDPKIARPLESVGEFLSASGSIMYYGYMMGRDVGRYEGALSPEDYVVQN